MYVISIRVIPRGIEFLFRLGGVWTPTSNWINPWIPNRFFVMYRNLSFWPIETSGFMRLSFAVSRFTTYLPWFPHCHPWPRLSSWPPQAPVWTSWLAWPLPSRPSLEFTAWRWPFPVFWWYPCKWRYVRITSCTSGSSPKSSGWCSYAWQWQTEAACCWRPEVISAWVPGPAPGISVFMTYTDGISYQSSTSNLCWTCSQPTSAPSSSTSLTPSSHSASGYCFSSAVTSPYSSKNLFTQQPVSETKTCHPITSAFLRWSRCFVRRVWKAPN